MALVPSVAAACVGSYWHCCRIASASARVAAWTARSRENLGVETLDLVQLHCPPTNAFYRPELFAAMDELVELARGAGARVVSESAPGYGCALRRGLESVDAVRAAGGGFVTVGVLPTVAARLMPATVRSFMERQPAQTVRIISGTNPVLVDRLRQGELDLVVGRLSNPELLAGLNFEYLYSERLSFVVRPGHPLLSQPAFDFARLLDFVVILPTPEMIIRPAVERLLAQHGLETRIRSVESVSNAFGRTYTRSGDAIWIISHGVVATDLEEGALAELAVDTGDSRGPVGLTTRIDTVPTPAAQVFMDTVRSVAERVRA